MTVLPLRPMTINSDITNTTISKPEKRSLHVTTEMISPPLSATPRYDFDTITPTIKPALSYISTKLAAKRIHITLIVGRGGHAPSPLTPTQISSSPDSLDLLIIPAQPFTPRTWSIFSKTVRKTSERYLPGRHWFTALLRSANQPQPATLICQSILQNHVLFSQEGLTLLNIDRMYTLKNRLAALSTGTGPLPWYAFVGSCIHLLHQIINHSHPTYRPAPQGAPLTACNIRRCYDHIAFNDDLLDLVARVYEEEYREIGIADEEDLPTSTSTSTSTPNNNNNDSSNSPHLPRAGNNTTGPSRKPSISRPIATIGRPAGPRTPLEKSDITPTTCGEWNRLLGRDGLGDTENKWKAMGGITVLPTSPCQGMAIV